MLVLSRKLGEKVVITAPDGTVTVVQVVQIDRGKVRLGFGAPEGVVIMREELLPAGPGTTEPGGAPTGAPP